MINNPSQNFPITIIQGATLSQTLNYFDPNGNPVDLTGYTADMQWRSTVEDTGSPILESSTGNGLIIISGNTLTYSVTSVSTSPLTNGQQMVYNLFITSPGGIVTALLAGPSYVQGSTIR